MLDHGDGVVRRESVASVSGTSGFRYGRSEFTERGQNGGSGVGHVVRG